MPEGENEGHTAAQVDGAKARLGTDFFTVVDGVGLQVVANIAHDEKCGNCAHFLAPSVLLIQVSAHQMVGEAGDGARRQEEPAKGKLTGKFCPSKRPSNL
jgi:hypothetical protein